MVATEDAASGSPMEKESGRGRVVDWYFVCSVLHLVGHLDLERERSIVYEEGR